MKLVYEDQQVCVVRHERGGGESRGKGKKIKSRHQQTKYTHTPTFITFKIQIHNFPYQMKKSINHKVIIRLATTLLLFLSTKATYIDTHITTPKKNSQKAQWKSRVFLWIQSPPVWNSLWITNLRSSMIAGFENIATFHEHKLWLWLWLCVCFCVHLSDELNWPWSEVLGIFLDEGKGSWFGHGSGVYNTNPESLLDSVMLPTSPTISILVRIFLSQKRRRRWGFGVCWVVPTWGLSRGI